MKQEACRQSHLNKFNKHICIEQMKKCQRLKWNKKNLTFVSQLTLSTQNRWVISQMHYFYGQTQDSETNI